MRHVETIDQGISFDECSGTFPDGRRDEGPEYVTYAEIRKILSSTSAPKPRPHYAHNPHEYRRLDPVPEWSNDSAMVACSDVIDSERRPYSVGLQRGQNVSQRRVDALRSSDVTSGDENSHRKLILTFFGQSPINVSKTISIW